ncbi:ATP-binding protein [Tropicimonas sp. IMCC6043]|uniref:hybrid sensor histidine kinase/response regulator n=1 Tax=Tropicimonas sp. IMCC6043 TaxID=2510645 RepID=UPI00101BEB6B|nr:ATP-binding protein [Tropicimonas sp. IMCC6043]RYH11385.1 response regulator [Tropicimonas sp. IMCC6043]
MNQHRATPNTPDDIDGGFFREAMEALSDGVAVFDADRRLVAWNERFGEMMEPIRERIVPGLRWEDMLQACVASGVYADAADREREWQANIGSDATGEMEIPLSDGSVHGVRYNPTESGGFVQVRRDVTATRRDSRSLQDSEALLRNILDTNPMPVIMARLRDGRIVYRSPTARALFGDTVFAQEHYISPADRDAYVRTLRREGTVDAQRMMFRVADGTPVPMSINGRLTQYRGEACVVSTLVDLRPHAEREAIIRKVVEHCPAPILMTEAESGRVLFRSPEIDRLFGTNENTHEFYVDPADRAGFLEALRRDGTVSDYKARFRGADGAPFWGAISARMFEYEGRDVIVSYSRDLTSQLAQELDLSQRRERMFQNDKLSALGGMLANVSHALNNPLSVVIGHALMLREESDDPEVIRQATRIGTAAERCSDIVKTYLTVSRQEPVELGAADVNEIVTTALEFTRQGLDEAGYSVTTRLAEDVPAVRADPDQMAQVVINLIENAQAAFADTGRVGNITVTTGSTASGCVRIVVEDDGPGVSKDIAGKIFDPFFTTRGVGDGKGIGLTWCNRVVQTHNGRISLDPAHRQGARFVIEIPALDQVADEEGAQAKERPAARILVVDDEADVADLNGEVLERVGYDVTVAYSGTEAVDAISRQPFDCIVSDLNMPDIDGRGVLDHIRRVRADAEPKTGFLTGDTMGRASQAFLREAGRPYIEKPVSPQELRDFVAGILAEGGRR